MDKNYETLEKFSGN